MAVSKRGKTRIVVDQETYYWSVPYLPGDDWPTLVVVSPDKSLCFHYPIDDWTHQRFMSALAEQQLVPPVPTFRTGQSSDTRNAEFSITPGFVRQLIQWCLAAECLSTPDWY
ncbi:hypothetical protein FYZ48_04210 [Gimesia chilikensis]|uniref:hypothetical protein n=1 Tax=Gimesia chilikensis TaxID=2605989 RepID=UPI0011EFCAF7|nr:hypothetical protein [Gimesia chilikensis]KAA0141589.1 hypothetical protein FYZ48_04210 [Gimesia chilikensis]